MYAYETETGHGERQIPFKDDNFIQSCRQINDRTPTQSVQIMDIDWLGKIGKHLYFKSLLTKCVLNPR